MIDRFESFVSNITVCYKSIQRIKSYEMSDLGLRGAHVMCLFFLNRHPEGLTASKLSVLCEEDKAAISRTLTDLSEKGYITADSSMGKSHYRAAVTLTDTGRAIAAQIDLKAEKWVSAIGEGLTDGERQAFYSSLIKISANLKAKYTEK